MANVGKIVVDPLVGEIVKACQRVGSMQEGLRKRRVDERFQLHCAVPLARLKPAGPYFKPDFVAWGMDVSLHGMGILVERPLEKGALLWANLRSLGKESYVFQIRVVHCQPLVGTMHRCGTTILGSLGSGFVLDPISGLEAGSAEGEEKQPGAETAESEGKTAPQPAKAKPRTPAAA